MRDYNDNLIKIKLIKCKFFNIYSALLKLIGFEKEIIEKCERYHFNRFIFYKFFTSI